MNTKFGDEIDWDNHIKEIFEEFKTEDRIFYEHGTYVDGGRIEPILKHINKGNLLDCGCHIGRWSRFFTKMGFDYTGIDQSSKAIEVAKKYNPDLKFINKFLWNMDFNQEFDVIVFLAVLQHNTHEEKRKILPKVYKALKDNGILLIAESTTNKETKTQLTYKGWIRLLIEHKFVFLESWHKNELNLDDHYIFRKI